MHLMGRGMQFITEPIPQPVNRKRRASNLIGHTETVDVTHPINVQTHSSANGTPRHSTHARHPIKWMTGSGATGGGRHKINHSSAPAKSSSVSPGYTLTQLMQMDALLRQLDCQYLRVIDINRIMRKQHGAPSVSSHLIERYLLLMGWQLQWKWHGLDSQTIEQASRQSDRSQCSRVLCQSNQCLQSLIDGAEPSARNDVISPEHLHRLLSIKT